MSAHPIFRPALAALHRLNRNRRVVRGAATGLHLIFRILPPILWDRMRWAQDLNARVDKAYPHGWDATLRRALGQPEEDYLPWRLSDLLGITPRRRTALGKLWHAEYLAGRWARMATHMRQTIRIKDDAEVTDGA